MKLLSFVAAGRLSYGLLEQGDRVRDCGAQLGSRAPDLKAVLDRNLLTELRKVAATAPILTPSDIILLPPIPNPGKIFCIGHNYEEHRQETGRPKTLHPSVFTRFADSQIANGAPAWIPAESAEIDYEGELAVVMGRGGRRIPAIDAMTYVAGYSCYNDISVRDWQRHTTQFTPGKNFPNTGAFGPWLVTSEEIPHPENLQLTTRLNGKIVQQASTAQLIFSIAELIEYCSTFTSLSPGDVIVTGTPGGVGFKREPQLFMRDGDVVEVEIEKVGLLRNPLEAERR